jgi:hypothetical protein
MIPMCLITGGVNLECLAKVVSPTVKLLIFCFVIDKYLG